MIDVKELKLLAQNNWDVILHALEIDVDASGKHSPCPICGGTDRFRFDNLNGNGTWFCNQCSPKAGDGIQLVMNYFKCSLPESLNKIKEVLDCIDTPPLNSNYQSEKKPLPSEQLLKNVNNYKEGKSEYLIEKGLPKELVLMDEYGTIQIPFKNISGEITTILSIAKDGTKRFLKDCIKKGSFYTIQYVSESNKYIIAEGLATALTIKLLGFNCNIIMAGDVNNVQPVIQSIRSKFPNSIFLIGADNDINSKKY